MFVTPEGFEEIERRDMTIRNSCSCARHEVIPDVECDPDPRRLARCDGSRLIRFASAGMTRSHFLPNSLSISVSFNST